MEKLTTGSIENADASKKDTKTAADKLNSKLPRKKKKKHNSALAAAAQARSATSQVGGHAYSDTDFRETGTNLSYREEI